MFKCVTKDGKYFNGYPIGDHPAFEGITLRYPDKVFTPFPKLFLMFTDETFEGGMVSVRNQAGFTIRASNPRTGVTYEDLCTQIKAIVPLMRQNPHVFNMRVWKDSPDSHLILDTVRQKHIGYFEAFIIPLYDTENIDFDKIDMYARNAEERESKCTHRQLPNNYGEDD